MNNPTDWETRFDKSMCERNGIHTCRLSNMHLNRTDRVIMKNFIRETLTAKEDALRKDIEGTKGFFVFKSTENGEEQLECVTKRSILALLTTKN